MVKTKNKSKIQEKIDQLKGYLKNGYMTINPPKGLNKANMEGWIAAMEWMLDV